jgi:hypothetical protein
VSLDVAAGTMQPTAKIALAGRRVLIVEDEYLTRRRFQKNFR